MQQALLTPAEAAARLGVHRNTLAQYVKRGRLSAVQLPSGHRRYRVSDLERILNPDPPPAA